MRKDDQDTNKRFFRAGDRVFRMNEQWWFTTREGDRGPYGSQAIATRELQSYIDAMKLLEDSKKRKEKLKETGRWHGVGSR